MRNDNLVVRKQVGEDKQATNRCQILCASPGPVGSEQTFEPRHEKTNVLHM